MSAPSWLIALIIAGVVVLFGSQQPRPDISPAQAQYAKLKMFAFVFVAAWGVLYFCLSGSSQHQAGGALSRDPVMDNIDVGDPTF
jgi:hypothetical protein